jgi:hypothetical protein
MCTGMPVAEKLASGEARAATVEVYLLRVKERLKKWPERSERKPSWVSMAAVELFRGPSPPKSGSGTFLCPGPSADDFDPYGPSWATGVFRVAAREKSDPLEPSAWRAVGRRPSAGAGTASRIAAKRATGTRLQKLTRPVKS